MKVSNIIVGAGLTGAVIAEHIASQLHEDVLVIDKRNHIGGNCYDYKSDNNITIQKYGPHFFHTNNCEVWNYLSKFTDWHYSVQKTKILIDNTLAPIPFNLNSIHTLFPKTLACRIEEKLIDKYGFGAKVSIMDMMNEKGDISFLANYIYEKMYKNYTYKQWGIYPDKIDKSVISRVLISISKNDGFFDDKYQGIPLNGYTNMIKNILSHPKISILLNTDFKDLKDISYNRIFYTGSIDEFFAYKFGMLPYRSLRFDIKKKEREYYQDVVTIRYPNNYDFTRIYEHKYFLNEKSKSTYISIEYPEPFSLGKNERFYPIVNTENMSIYNKYKEEASQLKNTFFCGRMGEYKYINMDVAVSRAIDVFQNSIKN